MLMPRPLRVWGQAGNLSSQLSSKAMLGRGGVWGQSENTGGNTRSWVQDSAWCLSSVLPTVSCVTLGKSLHSSEPPLASLDSEVVTMALASLACGEERTFGRSVWHD